MDSVRRNAEVTARLSPRPMPKVPTLPAFRSGNPWQVFRQPLKCGQGNRIRGGDRRVSRLARVILVLFLALPLAAVGFVAGMRYVKPEPALRLALQRMQAPTPPVRGRDASDAVWLLDYELPAGDESEKEC